MFRLTCVVLILITLTLPQTLFAKSKIEQAKGYATVGKKNEARALLRQAIQEDPLNADVHYEAGILYEQLGLVGKYDLAMQNACKLKSSNCHKVAHSYYLKGLSELSSGAKNSALRAFNQAFTYEPSKKTPALNRLLAKGESLLGSEQMKDAEEYFSALTSIDPSYKDQVAKLYYGAGQTASSAKAIELFRFVLRYSDTYKQRIGDDLAIMAKNSYLSEQERASLKREAGTYLTPDQMAVYFPPDFKIYAPGSYDFNLKPGETTDLWIMIPSGLNYYLSSHDYNYELRYSDGTLVKDSRSVVYPQKIYPKFKITAITDQVVTMRVLD